MHKKKDNPQKLTTPQLIDYMKQDMGITFKIWDEQKAIDFLSKHNYFFRLKLYAEAFGQKTKKGKCIGVDFKHLVELSTLDMYIRKFLLKMTIDLEHYLKVKLVNDCQNNASDNGFEVVKKFLSKNPLIKNSLESTSRLASYSNNKFSKYFENLAVWNVVEILSFYDFTLFYQFYYTHFKIPCKWANHFDSVRRLRNVAAHNNCLLCSFTPITNFSFDVEKSMELVAGNKTLSPNIITTCMKVPLLNDFTIMISLYVQAVSSKEIQEKTFAELKDFFEKRMIYHKDYFENNTDIKNAYKFVKMLIDTYA
ncbi:MAG: Abi family protein [Treponemataceae bacterium]